MDETIQELHRHLETRPGIIGTIKTKAGDTAGFLLSPFLNALALHALCILKETYDIPPGLIEKLQQYILRTQTQGTWSYSDQYIDAKEEYVLMVPPDIDTTSACLHALWMHKESWDEHKLLEYTFTLLKLEQAPGGPYDTWIMPKENRWKDCDPWVNKRIQAFLNTLGVPITIPIPPNPSFYYHSSSFPSLSLFEGTIVDPNEALFIHYKDTHLYCPLLIKLLNEANTVLHTKSVTYPEQDLLKLLSPQLCIHTMETISLLLKTPIDIMVNHSFPKHFAQWLNPQIIDTQTKDWCTWTLLATLTSRVLDDAIDGHTRRIPSIFTEELLFTFWSYTQELQLYSHIAQLQKAGGVNVIPWAPCLLVTSNKEVIEATIHFITTFFTLRKYHDDVADMETKDWINPTEPLYAAIQKLEDLTGRKAPQEIQTLLKEYTFIFKAKDYLSKYQKPTEN